MNFSLGGGDNQPNGRPAPLSEEEEAAAAESAARGANNREETRPISGVGTTGFMGKHRMTAAVNFLDQQIQIIQEELDKLETFGQASSVCKEVIASIESVPDALLPVTKGPLEVGWDRWFQGGHGSRNKRRWI